MQPQLAKVFKDAFAQGKFADGINVNWVLGEPYKAQPRACLVLSDRCSAAGDEIRKMEYFGNQKSWVEQAMKNPRWTTPPPLW